MLEEFVHWLTETVFAMGYPGILVLMALESSLLPVPSELVMPPAGYLVAQGRMSAVVAVGAGVAGSLLGAFLNYFLAVWLGRPLLHKYARYLLIREATLDRAEAFFLRHGDIATFLGRLLPVVRHLISMPAGLARMNMGRFALYTAAGAGVWCAILTYIGWLLGRNADVLQQEEVKRLTTLAILGLIPVMVIVIGVYIWQHQRR